MKTLHLTNPPQKGARALQHALIVAGLLPQKAADDEYGPQTAHAVEVAKWRLGYRETAIHKGHEFAGQQLLNFLTGTKPLPDDYAKRRALRLAPGDRAKSTQTKKEAAAAAIRAKIVAYCRWGIQHEPSIHYAQQRPMDRMNDLKHLPVYDDCSEFATKACKYAGAPDPNGLRYNGLGYTGTLLNGCRHISAAMVRPGDLVVFGEGTGHHVCVVLEPGPDPLLASHGQEKGPMEIRFSVEKAAQPPGVTWLQTVPDVA